MKYAIASNGEPMQEIQSLILRIQRLDQVVARWNTAMIVALILAALAAVAVVVTTRMALVRAKELADTQAELEKAKDRQLQLDLKSKDERISALDLAATSAKGDLATLQASASDAKAAQQRVETELAKQKERTAKAEQSASDAALALAKFKEPRSLTPEQQDQLVASVKRFTGQNFAIAVFPDPEPQAFARLLDRLLKSAQWNRVPSQIQRDGGVLVDINGESAAEITDAGIDAYIAPDDTESLEAQASICSVLNAFGIACERHHTPQLAGKTPKAITISVGKKP